MAGQNATDGGSDSDMHGETDKSHVDAISRIWLVYFHGVVLNFHSAVPIFGGAIGTLRSPTRTTLL